tara:strand:+ start:8435 stop:9661 length:1227 start_codon:yes stop_codon:yes gene_type:complete
MLLAKTTINKEELKGLAAAFVLVDLLFFPYFQILVMPISLPFIIIYIFFDGDFNFPNRYFIFFSIVAFFTLFSTYLSVFISDYNYFLENFKRSVQFLTSFIYFSFFYYISSSLRRGFVSENLLLAFLLLFLALSVAFYFDPLYVNSLLKTVYGKTVTSDDVVSLHRRYAYFFTDPNTAAYFLLIACVPLFYVTRNIRSFIVVFFLIGSSLVMTQSRGGLLVFFLCTVIGFFSLISSMEASKRVSLVLSIAFVSCLSIFFFYFFFSGEEVFLEFSRSLTDFDRLTKYSDDSRFDIWASFISTVELFPLGRGYIIFVDGEVIKPHSDFLRLLYSYGVVVFAFILIFFAFLLYRFPLFVVPALGAFFINTLIDEQKLFSLFLCWAGVLLRIYEVAPNKYRSTTADLFFKGS